MHIVLCFNGNHTHCDAWSNVCSAGDTPDYVPTHLPNGEYVHMTKQDKELMYNCLLQAKLGACEKEKAQLKLEVDELRLEVNAPKSNSHLGENK